MTLPRVGVLLLVLCLAACDADTPPADLPPPATATATTNALAPVHDALAQGQNVVVTFLPEDAADRRSDDPFDETYADWAFHLNDFLSVSDAVQFTFPLDQAAVLFDDVRPDSLSTLFLRPDGTALFHQTPIVEDYVYAFASAYFRAQDDQLTLTGLLGLPPGDIDEPEDLATALGFRRVTVDATAK